jgi:hypothetical protein
MADTAFDFLGDSTIRTSAGDVARKQAKEEEDAFSEAVSVWRGNKGFLNLAQPTL